MLGFAERERALYLFLTRIIRDKASFVVTKRIESLSLTTGELFEENDTGKMITLSEELTNKLCSVLYAADQLPEESIDYDTEEIKERVREMRSKLGEIYRNVENREPLKELANKDLNQGTTLVYCVAQLENFIRKHTTLPSRIRVSINDMIESLELTASMRECVESQKTGYRR